MSILRWLTSGGTYAEVSASNPLPVNATVNASAAALANAAAPSYSEGTTNPLSADLTGALRITGTINASSSMRSTTAAPSYVNGTDNSLSSNLTGDLRTIAKQSGTWTVGVDQSTPGTTNAVAATNFPTAVDVNSGSKSNSTLRVVIATDQPALTNALKVDGSAVTQPVSNAGTFAVQAAQSGTWNIGTVTTITGVTTAFGATAAAVPANAGYQGLIGKTALPTAVSDGQLVGAMADKFGRQITRTAPRDLLLPFIVSATGTSGTLLAAQGANVFADIARLLITNESATDVIVAISDGTNSYPFGLKAGTTAGWSGPGDTAQPAATANTAWTYTVSSGVTTIRMHGVAVLNK
jgi:hypothetical protein